MRVEEVMKRALMTFAVCVVFAVMSMHAQEAEWKPQGPVPRAAATGAGAAGAPMAASATESTRTLVVAARRARWNGSECRVNAA